MLASVYSPTHHIPTEPGLGQGEVHPTLWSGPSALRFSTKTQSPSFKPLPSCNGERMGPNGPSPPKLAPEWVACPQESISRKLQVWPPLPPSLLPLSWPLQGPEVRGFLEAYVVGREWLWGGGWGARSWQESRVENGARWAHTGDGALPCRGA